MECKNCNGDGEHYDRHPAWGTPSCPEAYVTVSCEECNGTGEVLAECDNCGEMKVDIITGMSHAGETSQCGDCRSVQR